MKTYKLKLTALSPIHIGTGESYEPTNFVITDGYLYEFQEDLFFKNLPQSEKIEFSRITNLQSENGYELFEKVHSFILKNKKYAKEVAINKIKVSEELEKHYEKSIAKPVQQEGKSNNKKSVFNKFEIQKTQRLANNVSTYLSGSSLKGSISTAYQEYIFKKFDKRRMNRLFSDDKLFRNLSISDTLAQNTNSEIGYSVNKERFENEDSAEISTFIEVNSKNSEYLIELSINDFLNDDKKIIDEMITKEKIIEACNSHYKVIFEDKERKINLLPNQFLISVGKHSGARAVTIDGLRKILVKLAQISNKQDEGDDFEKRIERLHKKSHFENNNLISLFAKFEHLEDKEKKDWKNAKAFIERPSDLERIVTDKKSMTINAILTEETTIWRFGESKDSDDLDSFGWLLCEFIEENEYESLYNKYKMIEKSLINDKQIRQEGALKTIQKSKEEVENLKAQKEQQKLEAEKEFQEKKRIEAERLASLSPFEQKLDELISKNSSVPKTTLILNSVKNGELEEFKSESLQMLKKLMIQNKEWKEQPTGKKPEKDREYQKTLEIKKLMNI